MSRRLIRLPLLSVLLLSSQVWAIGLGDIKLDSALNEPLRAEIALLSASPDELDDLTVALASSETFARYGIDRPFYLQGMQFNVINGGNGGSIVQIRSRAPITEPFLTFLVEATWSSGRLLREYTVLLDPPTYAPPQVQQAPAVTAPVRTTPSDSGRIERQSPAASTPPAQQTQPTSRPSSGARAPTVSDPKPLPPPDDVPYASNNANELVVQRGDTLWGVASRMRPDNRLTMNQTMLAIYQANPDAFAGNINALKAGARLRVPSADEVFQINRGDALSEVQRQHSAWSGGSYTPPADTSQPSLTLVPPDDEPAGSDYDDASSYEPLSREEQIEARISELESADIPEQQSLIEIRDSELANLRQELANIRGEVYEPPVADTADDMGDEPVDDEVLMYDPDADIDDVMADDSAEDMADDAADIDETADDAAAADAADSSDVVRTSRADEPTIVDQAIGFLTGFWGIIIGALLLVLGGLIWFMRRGSDDDDDGYKPWERLDEDDAGIDTGATMSATESLEAPTPEEAFVVVEQDSGVHPVIDETVETPAVAADAGDGSGSFGSLEDTFSSETAVNLDQTDPIAEADFHMAYGLYDQAADLINGALESDPNDKALMSKLCEIYFVWGNRDAFVDAASRMKAAVGDGDNAEWDKIVIMGQQIAADHDMFAGAGVAGATKAVDLSFEDSGDATGALDMDFGAGDSSDASDVIDLGEGDADGDAVDFGFTDEEDLDLDSTAESPTIATPVDEVTAEMPTPTVETPTIEEQFEGFDDGTSELPSLEESVGQDAGATAEINLDELDLGGSELDETEIAGFDDLDITGTNESLSDTGINELIADPNDETGRNPEIDPNATGIQQGIDPSATGLVEGLDLSDLEDTGMRLAPDETGQNPLVSAEHEHDSSGTDIDDSLLDATGHTQILSDDMAVETAAGLDGAIGDGDATMLASGLGDEEPETMVASLDDDDDFDFAKTEALPAEAFSGDSDLEATAETPAIAETDVDLDLDDLTAALQVSEVGDTVEQPRDDATVEQPRPTLQDDTAEVPTMSLGPEDISGDLHEARTMTEVGTKLDLARAYVDMGDPAGARSILEEVLDEGDDGQKQQAQQLLDSLPG